MSEFTEAILEDKLSNLTGSDSSIKQLSAWIISQRSHFQVISATLYKVLVITKQVKTLAFVYLVHETVVRSKNKHPEFIVEFGNLLKKVLEYLVESNDLEEKNKSSISDLIQLWRKDQLFDINKQNEFENIWKTNITGDSNTLKREKSQSTSLEDSKASNLGQNLHCYLCQEDGHVTSEGCHAHALCRNCGIKGHIRKKCPRLSAVMENNENERTKGGVKEEQRVYERNENVRPELEGNKNCREANNKNDDDDVIILEQKVGGAKMPIATIDLEENPENEEWTDGDKNESTKKLSEVQMGGPSEGFVSSNDTNTESVSRGVNSRRRNEPFVNKNDEKSNTDGLCGGIEEGTAIGTKEMEQLPFAQNSSFASERCGNSYPVEVDKEPLELEVEVSKLDVTPNIAKSWVAKIEPLDSSHFEVNNNCSKNDVIFIEVAIKSADSKNCNQEKVQNKPPANAIPSRKAAKRAKNDLHGTEILKRPCTFNMEYVKKDESQVHKNSETGCNINTGFKEVEETCEAKRGEETSRENEEREVKLFKYSDEEGTSNISKGRGKLLNKAFQENKKKDKDSVGKLRKTDEKKSSVKLGQRKPRRLSLEALKSSKRLETLSLVNDCSQFEAQFDTAQFDTDENKSSVKLRTRKPRKLSTLKSSKRLETSFVNDCSQFEAQFDVHNLDRFQETVQNFEDSYNEDIFGPKRQNIKISNPPTKDVILDLHNKEPISALHELCQKNKWKRPKFNDMEEYARGSTK